MKRLLAYFGLSTALLCYQSAQAGTGNFFTVTSTGTPVTLALTLCLDGKAQQSCQDYTASGQTLQISTVIPNHTYPGAGIRINTPGYTLAGCAPASNGFCLFSVNDKTASTINTAVLTTPLTASVSSLALMINGVARQIVITNTGIATAANVIYSVSPALPAGTTISPASCGVLAPGGTCTLTITPGAIPSAAPGNANPTPITLTIASNNTNSLTPTINIVTYGSVVQSGYLFAIDDTTPITGSIGGKIASLTDEVTPNSTAIIWASNGTVTNVDRFDIPGVYDTSTAGTGSCNGNSDGSCNSTLILNHYQPTTSYPLSFYAAGICTETIGDYADWYLPAICEMGYDSLSIGSGCGTVGAPTFPNMQSNLVDNGNIGGLSGTYWSSTEYTKLIGNPTDDAWVQTFGVSSPEQTGSDKSVNFAIRCVRALT